VSSLNSDVFIIHCGDRYGHPAQAIIERLLFSLPTERALFLPNVCTEDRNYYTATIPDDDIVVISSDGVNYTVNGQPFQARP